MRRKLHVKIALMLLLWVTYEAFDKLDMQYCIAYGNPKAKIHMTEYFSFSCHQCMQLIRKEFPSVKQQYVDTGEVYWIFHPDPADILTLQALVCFEELNSMQEKQLFLEMVAEKSWIEVASFAKIMDLLHHPIAISQLEKLTYLEKTSAFKSSYAYEVQKDVPSATPTIEMNGVIFQEFPNKAFVDKLITKAKQEKSLNI